MAYEVIMPYHLHMPSYFLETFTEYPNIITMSWNPRMHLRPIPQTAIDLNPLLADDQNPGY